MKGKKLCMVIIHIITFIVLFAFFLQASRTTWDGYLFKEEWDLFSTKTGYSYVYHGEDDYSWINGTPYHSRCWMNVIVNSQDGFLVGNDININITNGFVDFYREGIPDVDNISIRIHFEPALKIGNGSFVYEIRDINASFNGKTRFEFNNLNLNLNAQYIVSGAKDIRVYALVNDSNISRNYIANYGNDAFIDVEPAYTMTQLKLAKSVLILTYWVLFFSIITMTFKIFKPNEEKSKNENQKGSKNMYEKILKYFPNAFYLLSVLIIALGIIFMVIGAFAYGIGGNEFVLTGASILITLGIGCFSLGFAFLSIGIAKESDKKMITIGKANFMGIDSSLKNVTITNLNNLNDKKIRCLTILSWRTGLIQAERLRVYANDNERDSMVFPFISVMEGLPWEDNRIGNVEIDWIISIYKSIRILHPNVERLERFQELFYTNIAHLRDGENFNQLLERIQTQLRAHPNEIFQRVE